MDGIDAALLETDGSADYLVEIADTTLPYDPAFKILLKAAEYAVRLYKGNLLDAETHFQQALKHYLVEELIIPLSELDSKLKNLSVYLYGESLAHLPITFGRIVEHSTQCHATAVNQLLEESGFTAEQIDVVGYHGQCFFHQPQKKISIIVGDGQALADHVHITVVNDFRSCDIAAGGLGAPFAPLYHQALAIRDAKIPVAVVNCGGIANITLVKNANEDDLIAYDAGPGNGLIDRLVRQRTSGRENMDCHGAYGLKGSVDEAVLDKLFASALHQEGQNYFSLKPPKSLDIGDMHLIPVLASLSLEDACATLEAFTARSIVNSLDLLDTPMPHQWVLAGGGWNNPVIEREFRAALQQKLGESVEILSADQAGWNSRAMEAQIFAYLAVRSLQKKPLSVFGTTQVPTPQTGGQTYLPSRGATPSVQRLIAANSEVLC